MVDSYTPKIDAPLLDAAWLDDVPDSRPNAGYAVYPPGGMFGPRVQLAYQLVLPHTGWARVLVDGVERTIQAGEVGLLLPGQREVFFFAEDRETRHSWIALPARMATPELRARLHEAAQCAPVSLALQGCMDVGREVGPVDEPQHRPVLAAVAFAALTLYVAEVERAARTGRRPLGVVAVAREVARRRACEGIGVAELAREVGLSTEHLVRLFHRELGVTPGAFLRTERLAHAMRLLEHTGLSVAEVARQSGFASAHHFARCLRMATGMTPTELRARRERILDDTHTRADV